MTGAPLDWDAVGLVVFDVDGTLYDQGALRRDMARALALDALRARSLKTLRILRAYRRLREAMSEEDVEDFEPRLVARVAVACGVEASDARARVEDWMLARPLSRLAARAYPGVAELFAALRRGGKIVGVFSDYPAAAKLAALGLVADAVVAAGDPLVQRLKPNPRGLELLMRNSGLGPDRTLLIGDRPERDGEAARRAGAMALIRSDRPISGWRTFSGFSDPVFAPLFEAT